MRIVEPQSAPAEVKRNKRKKLPLLLFALLLSLIIASSVYVLREQENPGTEVLVGDDTTILEENFSNDEEFQKTGELRIFTDNEFTVFYNNLLQPDLERVENPPTITGNDDADIRIRSIAEARGYRLRSSPSDTATLVTVDGYQLHARVAEPWEALQQSAADDGLQVSIVSGYRSVESQRSIFTSRLAAAGATIAAVAEGLADDIVDEVLIQSSIPGYSKHHTAYTVDLKCAGFIFEDFKDSPCFTWIAANNYEKAKEHGFIPSYPPEADAQGPDPEAWEYVYVGKELLTQ